MLGAAGGKSGISQAASFCASLFVPVWCNQCRPWCVSIAQFGIGMCWRSGSFFFTLCQWYHCCFPWPETPAARTKLGVGLWHIFQEEKEGQEAKGALEQ